MSIRLNGHCQCPVTCRDVPGLSDLRGVQGQLRKDKEVLCRQILQMVPFDSVQGPVPFASLVSQLFLIIWLAIAAEITVGL